MKKVFHKLKKFFIIALAFCLMFSTDVFAEMSSSGMIYTSGTNNPDLGPAESKYIDLAVTGDSYAGLLCKFEQNRGFFMHGYAVAGQSIFENRDIMLKAFDSEYKIVVVSIGVNDHMRSTPPEFFEGLLMECLAHAIDNHKIVIFHSYVNYPLGNLLNVLYPTEVYDNILKNLASRFEFVHYIDINDYATKEYIAEDNIHFKKEFYDALWTRMIAEINKFKY